MPRRVPKKLSEVSAMPGWSDDKRIIQAAYRVVPAEAGSAERHFAGGPATHAGATCSRCETPLTLVWDFDLADPAIPADVRAGFAPATRLPLYVCWKCLGAGYMVLNDKQIRMVEFDLSTSPCEEGESPVEDGPAELSRRALHLIEIVADEEDGRDSNVAQLDDSDEDEGDEPAAGILGQFGGELQPYQGHDEIACVNPDCPIFAAFRKRKVPTKYHAKSLALVGPSANEVQSEHYFQLAYYLCGACYCVLCQYHCT